MKANEKYQAAKAANATSGVGTVNVINAETRVVIDVIEPALNITVETTLNELIALARNNAVEKPETTPKFGTLRKKCRSGEYHCIASLKADAMFELYVYDCGYAGYESYGKTTVIDLDEIFTVMYPSNYYDTSLEASTIGNSPWGYALVILGDEQIDFQWNKEKAHDFVSEDDNGSISADACDCGGLSKSQKINQPALAAHIDDPETAYIKKETNGEIRWALSKTRAEMTEKQAEAFRLYYDEDMTLEEISRALGIKIQSVADRLDGVSKKLHKNMKQFL